MLHYITNVIRVAVHDSMSTVTSGARADVTTDVDQFCLKEVLECGKEAVSTVKQEPWHGLYADHVFKDELVVVPVHFQRPHIVGTNSAPGLKPRPDSTRDRNRGHQALNDCFVRLVRVRNHEESHVNYTPTNSIKKNILFKKKIVTNKLVQGIEKRNFTDKNFVLKKDYKTDNDRKLKCDVCGKIFVVATELMDHLMVHILAPFNIKENGREARDQGTSKLSNHNHSVTSPHKNLLCPVSTHPLPSNTTITPSSAAQIIKENIRIDTLQHTLQKNTYVCDTCGKIFRQKNCLIHHFQGHLRRQQTILVVQTNKNFEIREKSYVQSKDKPKRLKTTAKGHACGTCKKVFTAPNKLKRHQRIHTGEKPFSCDICQKKFITNNDVKLHKRIHTREKPYVCDVCQKRFSQSSSLKTHERIHTGEKPYCCKFCNKAFTQSGHLTIHERTHTGSKPFACHLCNKKFSESHKLKIHFLIHTETKPYACEICKKKFRQLPHLNLHKLTHSGEREYFCEICEKTFIDTGQLRKHKQIHTGIKRHTCQTCKKQFSQKNALIKHVRTHTGEKPYSCNICKKRCSERGSLKTHMRTHTGEKPYYCQICFEQFTYLCTLRAHTKNHTREMFSCKTCLQQFTKLADLKRHGRIHEGQKLYSCDTCERWFIHKTPIVRHLQTHDKKKRS